MSSKRILDGLSQAAQCRVSVVSVSEGRSCNCIGPQAGQPLCPCLMRDVQVKDGRYVRVQDLGPAPRGALQDSLAAFIVQPDRVEDRTALKLGLV